MEKSKTRKELNDTISPNKRKHYQFSQSQTGINECQVEDSFKKMKLNEEENLSNDLPINITLSNLTNTSFQLEEDMEDTRIPLILTTDTWEAIECGNSGDCLFNSVCFLLNKPHEEHLELRKQAVITIRGNLAHYMNFYWMDEQGIDSYLDEMSNEGVWGSELEVAGLSEYLKSMIVVYRPEYNGNDVINFISPILYGRNYKVKDPPLYIVYYRNRRHYQALVRKESSSLLNESLSDVSEILEVKPFECTLSLPEQNFQEELVKSHKEKKYVLFSKTLDRYTEIWDYQKYQKLPQRLQKKEEKDNIEKTENKPTLNEEERKKLKRLQKKIRDKRYEWKKGVSRFYIDQEKDRLLENKQVPYSHLPRNQIKPEWKSDKKIYNANFFIPYQEEIPILLQKAHGLHIGRDRMRESLHCLGYSWEGMTNDIVKYIQNCTGCRQIVHLSKTDKNRKQLISAHPRQRYQIDCLKLYEELSDNKHKILICIIDHFSKFLHARIVESQNAREVEITLRQFFRLVGIPQILQSDNGREFDNKRINVYLEEQQIKFVHGRPYHPESQGCIERSHKTLQEGLKKYYVQNKANFYIESALEACLDLYNMEIHSTTKMRPTDAIKLDPKNEKDQNNIDFVIFNTKNSRKQAKNVLEGYEKGDKVLIYNYLLKGKMKNYLEEVRGKMTSKVIKGMLKYSYIKKIGYIIPAVVMGLHDTLLEIKIEKDSKIVKDQVKKDEIYKIEERFVLQVGEEHWKKQFEKD